MTRVEMCVYYLYSEVLWQGQVSSKCGGWLRRHLMNGRGQQTVGGPSAVWLDERLAALPHKKSASYKSLHGTQFERPMQWKVFSGEYMCA